MKNIYIVGVPRSGKSTLARLIKKSYPIYNQLSFEAIRNGFIESQPELNMENRNSEARDKILPLHIVTLAHWNKEILGAPSLIEGDFTTVEKLKSLTSEDDEIICLGLGVRPIEEIIGGIKSNDRESDYTKNWSEEKMKKHFYDLVQKDENNYNFCKNNGIKYFDTYSNRMEVFDEIIRHISADNK